MDSARPHPPAVEAISDAAAPVSGPVSAPVALADADATSPGALARVGRWLPRVRGIVRFAYRSALAGVVSAGLIVAALAQAGVWRDALVVLGVALAVPPLAVALAGWTLADLASLPAQVRDAALAAAGKGSDAKPQKGSRLGGLVRSLWAMRGLALLSRDGWFKVVGAVRFVRLASLPFLLGLIAMAVLNAAVIAGGVAALLVLAF